MDTNNKQQLNSILDKHNECKDALQEEYNTGTIDCKTMWHIKASLASILQRIPRDKFEWLRKELYDLFKIIKM